MPQSLQHHVSKNHLRHLYTSSATYFDPRDKAKAKHRHTFKWPRSFRGDMSVVASFRYATYQPTLPGVRLHRSHFSQKLEHTVYSLVLLYSTTLLATRCEKETKAGRARNTVEIHCAFSLMVALYATQHLYSSLLDALVNKYRCMCPAWTLCKGCNPRPQCNGAVDNYLKRVVKWLKQGLRYSIVHDWILSLELLISSTL